MASSNIKKVHHYGTAPTPFAQDHGALTGLADDDHTQYHNNARGDARYSPLAHDHDADYAALGHDHDADYAALGHDHAGVYAPNSHVHAAAVVTYDNTASGLAAAQVQAAIDEIMASVGPSASGFFRFDAVTTAADPGSGQLRYNNATPASVTALYVDQLSQPGTDVDRLFGMLAVGMVLLVQQKNDATRYLRGTISSTPTNNTGWWTIPVTVAASGALPNAGASCNFVLLGGGASSSAASGCIVTRAASQSFSTVSSFVSWDTEVRDEENYWDAGAPTRITIPVTGWYQVVGTVVQGADADDVQQLSFAKNGAGISTTQHRTRLTAGSAAIAVESQVVDLDYYTAGDYIEMRVQNRSGTSTGTARLSILRR